MGYSLEIKKPPRSTRWFFEIGLGERHFFGARAFFSINDFKGNGIANFEFIVGNAVQILRMEEKIFRFAFASDKSKSSGRQCFDFPCHNYYFYSPEIRPH